MRQSILWAILYVLGIACVFLAGASTLYGVQGLPYPVIAAVAGLVLSTWAADKYEESTY
jgi:hypothetical protein